MLNTPWMHPRDIDWTDSHNPLRLRAWNRTNNRFMYDTLNDPVWQALRNAKNLEPRIHVTPTPINQTIAGSATYDQTVAIEPNTWLYGVNASGSDPAGFYAQITDALTGATVFSQLVQSADLKPPSNARGVILYLAAPRLFLPPSYPVIRIVNQSINPQLCTLNLFCVVEIAPAGI